MSWKYVQINTETGQERTTSSGGGGGSSSAADVSYENTTSGLSASNVQAAIDEIAQDFQDGCDTISQAVIAKGQTPASNSPADIAYAISQISGGGGAGSLTPIEVHYFDLNTGYVSSGNWNYGRQNPDCYSDVYEIEAGNYYLISLGGTVGTRFRPMFSTFDTSTQTSTRSGSYIYEQDNPAAYKTYVYYCTTSGYLTIGKDNAGNANVKTYVYVVNDL